MCFTERRLIYPASLVINFTYQSKIVLKYMRSLCKRTVMFTTVNVLCCLSYINTSKRCGLYVVERKEPISINLSFSENIYSSPMFIIINIVNVNHNFLCRIAVQPNSKPNKKCECLKFVLYLKSIMLPTFV